MRKGEITLKRISLCLLVIMIIILTVPAYAVSPRATMVVPNITFNGTEADCNVRITANKATDKIVATMELWQGTTLIDSWNGNGLWTLKLNGTADVQKNKTYTLVIEYSINGVNQTPATYSRTNR